MMTPEEKEEARAVLGERDALFAKLMVLAGERDAALANLSKVEGENHAIKALFLELEGWLREESEAEKAKMDDAEEQPMATFILERFFPDGQDRPEDCGVCQKIAAERDLLSAKLAEIEKWCRDNIALVNMDTILSRFFEVKSEPEDKTKPSVVCPCGATPFWHDDGSGK